MSTDTRRRGMTRRAIARTLRGKMDELIDAMDEPHIKEALRDHSIVSGGAIASMLLGEWPNDIDIYLKEPSLARMITNHIIQKALEEHGPGHGIENWLGMTSSQTVPMPGFLALEPIEGRVRIGRLLFITKNAVTLSGDFQIITRFSGPAAEIVGNYDFMHCMNSWDAGTNDLRLDPRALECLLSRTLVYNSRGARYPLASLVRVRKFLKRGWHIDGGNLLKIALSLSNMDLTDPRVLKEQLVGVDCAYFAALMRAIHERTNNDEPISVEWLEQTIDDIL